MLYCDMRYYCVIKQIKGKCFVKLQQKIKNLFAIKETITTTIQVIDLKTWPLLKQIELRIKFFFLFFFRK